MARLSNRVLFFTTSPRTPAKMIPEIELLCNNLSGEKWDPHSQSAFIEALAQSNFFEGEGSPKDKAFSARDRINRAPKALGFVDLYPRIKLTDAGEEFVKGRRPQEVFLRQLLKFQLPSPYHVEKDNIKGSFFIKPYLEIIRLIRELSYLTFDEVKIFAVQLTDYRQFEAIKAKIINFRQQKEQHKGEYKKFVYEVWTKAVEEIYYDTIMSGDTRTRQSKDSSLKKFITTKRSNLRDYADACFRYLRYTGLVSISHKGRSISFFEDKINEVDFILQSVDRTPQFVDDLAEYKRILFNAKIPLLYGDNKDNLIDTIMRISSHTKSNLLKLTIGELKDLRDDIIHERKETILHDQVIQLKSYALYSEIIDTYNEIISDELYDAPLMLEWNTWRAMTMLNGGNIKGNFKLDDMGQPLSTALGNMPDIECDYEDFALSVEVTLQSGQRQYEAEGEPVARHYGQLKKRVAKETYCLFIAPTINSATLAHFFTLNKIDISYYGGKAKIIPLELDQFMRLVENSYIYNGQPSSSHVKTFLDQVVIMTETSQNEIEWMELINTCICDWPVA